MEGFPNEGVECPYCFKTLKNEVGKKRHLPHCRIRKGETAEEVLTRRQYSHWFARCGGLVDIDWTEDGETESNVWLADEKASRPEDNDTSRTPVRKISGPAVEEAAEANEKESSESVVGKTLETSEKEASQTDDKKALETVYNKLDGHCKEVLDMNKPSFYLSPLTGRPLLGIIAMSQSRSATAVSLDNRQKPTPCTAPASSSARKRSFEETIDVNLTEPCANTSKCQHRLSTSSASCVEQDEDHPQQVHVGEAEGSIDVLDSGDQPLAKSFPSSEASGEQEDDHPQKAHFIKTERGIDDPDMEELASSQLPVPPSETSSEQEESQMEQAELTSSPLPFPRCEDSSEHDENGFIHLDECAELWDRPLPRPPNPPSESMDHQAPLQESISPHTTLRSSRSSGIADDMSVHNSTTQARSRSTSIKRSANKIHGPAHSSQDAASRLDDRFALPSDSAPQTPTKYDCKQSKTKAMPSGPRGIQRLCDVKSSSSHLSISDERYHPFHDETDYALARFFSNAGVTDLEVDDFFNDARLKSLHQFISFRNGKEWQQKMQDLRRMKVETIKHRR